MTVPKTSSSDNDANPLPTAGGWVIVYLDDAETTCVSHVVGPFATEDLAKAELVKTYPDLERDEYGVLRTEDGEAVASIALLCNP